MLADSSQSSMQWSIYFLKFCEYQSIKYSQQQ
jgi:hypothetical protein